MPSVPHLGGGTSATVHSTSTSNLGLKSAITSSPEIPSGQVYKFNYLNVKLVAWTVSTAAIVFVVFLSWDFWFVQRPLSQAPTEMYALPFKVSSTDVVFEVGSGSYLSITVQTPLSEPTDINIVLDDYDIVNIPINSFTIQPTSNSINYFIPLHSKNVAGHCVISFKTKSKLPELESLYKLRIKVKVVHHTLFSYMSIVTGWLYFVCWSACYYPQIYSNYKRKSVVGYSFDYLALNLTGHICYFIYNFSMFYNSEVQKQFAKIHPKGEMPVHFNDALFSAHAVTMNLVLLAQCAFYERGDQRVSLPMKTLVGSLWTIIILALMAGIAQKITWLQFMYYVSYIKVGTTPIKGTPQVYMNYIRGSTEGWSIQGVILDVGGGVFSFLQMIIDAVNNDDWDGTLGNPGKMALSMISLIYDSIFLCQHYICFSTPRRKAMTRDKQEHSEFVEKLDKLKASFGSTSVGLKQGSKISLMNL